MLKASRRRKERPSRRPARPREGVRRRADAEGMVQRRARGFAVRAYRKRAAGQSIERRAVLVRSLSGCWNRRRQAAVAVQRSLSCFGTCATHKWT